MNVGFKTMGGALAAILLLGGCSRQAQAPSESAALPATLAGEASSQLAPAATAQPQRKTTPEMQAKMVDKTKAAKKTADRIVWEPSLEQALAKMKAENRILMVDFDAKWCGACKILDRKIFPDSRVVEAARPFVSVHVDTDKYTQVSSDFQVSSLPTIILFSPRGRILKRIEGTRAPEVLAALMHDATTRGIFG